MSHKLLLADDSVTIQRVIELTFADEDVEVTAVGDGQLAIDRLDIDPPDIILADIDMPKRDGYEVAAYVKSRPKLAHIPVVLLTGAFEPIDQARAAAAGSSDVLAKPFEPQMVINRVKELLGRKRQDGAPEYAPSAPPAAPQPAAAPAPPPQAVSAPSVHRPSNDNAPVSLDDYFDQLDAAFSNLQPSGGSQAANDQELDWAEVTSDEPVAAAPVPPPPVPQPVAVAPKPVAVPPPVAAPPPAAPVASAFAPTSQNASTFAPTTPNAPADRPVDKLADKMGFVPPASGPVAVPPRASASTFAPTSQNASVDKPTFAPTVPSAPADRSADKPEDAFAYAPKPISFAPAPPTASTFAPTSQTASADTSVFAPTAPDAPADKPADEAHEFEPPPMAALFAQPAPPPAAPVAAAPASPAPKVSTNPFANLSAAKAEAAARPVAPVITDELIQEIVSRVLAQMTDKVVRETVSEIVSQTAERLVQEEIERIKNSTE